MQKAFADFAATLRKLGNRDIRISERRQFPDAPEKGMYLMVNFVQQEIENDLKEGKYSDGIHTRFPPEPNGYLHIGHAKSVCLNFGLAAHNNGLCNLRFDDTNPTKEDTEYVDSIQEDIKWLGFDWDDRKFFASDYLGLLTSMIRVRTKFGKCVGL